MPTPSPKFVSIPAACCGADAAPFPPSPPTHPPPPPPTHLQHAADAAPFPPSPPTHPPAPTPTHPPAACCGCCPLPSISTHPPTRPPPPTHPPAHPPTCSMLRMLALVSSSLNPAPLPQQRCNRSPLCLAPTCAPHLARSSPCSEPGGPSMRWMKEGGSTSSATALQGESRRQFVQPQQAGATPRRPQQLHQEQQQQRQQQQQQHHHPAESKP